MMKHNKKFGSFLQLVLYKKNKKVNWKMLERGPPIKFMPLGLFFKSFS